MSKRCTSSGYDKRRRWIFTCVISLTIFTAIFFLASVPLIIKPPHIRAEERKTVQTLWENADYEKTFNIGEETLKNSPLDYDSLILRGFSAYQLSLSQITEASKQAYIDITIRDLRKALIVKSTDKDGFVFYVLGKAYYNKGANFADLAVKFLELSQGIQWEQGRAVDTPEWLGLAYATLHDYSSSADAFTEALSLQHPPSDLLLLAIAQSYKQLGNDMAVSYLKLCIDISKDYKAIIQARLLLGEIFENNDVQSAKEQYTEILNGVGENAEAHYRLGEIYARENDPIRARAEWRKAIRVDPTHSPSRERLAIR
jgi:tetratricopeptide (TPR) repeat protein